MAFGVNQYIMIKGDNRQVYQHITVAYIYYVVEEEIIDRCIAIHNECLKNI